MHGATASIGGPKASARTLFVLDRQGTIRFSEAYPDALNPAVNDLLTTLEALATEDNEDNEDEATRHNITVSTETELVGVAGGHRLEAITVRCAGAEITETLPADGVFIFIGATVKTDWLPQEIVRDAQGYLATGADVPAASWPRDVTHRDPFLLETSVPGIFATGDVRQGSVKRVAAGVGEGSMAIAFI